MIALHRRALALLLRGTFAANRLRMALTLACIALGVALAGAVHTVHTSALAEIDRAARSLSGSADAEIRGPRSGFDDALFAAIAARPEVAVASPVLEFDAALAGSGDALRVIGIDPLRAVRLQPAFVANAATLSRASQSATLLDPRNAWLTPSAASRNGLKEGDTLRLVAGSREVELHIAGILQGMADAGEAAFLDVASAQLDFARIGRLSRIDVRLRPDADAADFVRAVSPSLPAGVVASPARSVTGRAADITRAYRVNLDALAMVALASGAFLVFSTLALQAARRRQEFALLRALGVTRRGLSALLALEGALIGAIGSALGTLLGLAFSAVLLHGTGADLGAGFFGAVGMQVAPDPWALAFIAALGIAMSVAGALWVAGAVARIEVAEALRDRSVDLPAPRQGGAAMALALFAAGVPLLFVPPIRGLPLAGYGAIALWLAASVAAVAPVCRWMLARAKAGDAPVASLAVAQVRHLPGHLAASVAGIVVSASLCVAMAIMVHSFRVSVERWLDTVIGADVYVRSSLSADSTFFDAAEQRAIASLPAVASIEPLRYDRVVMDANGPPLSIVARPLDARILAGFQAEPREWPQPAGDIPVWISEAARDIYHWRSGDRIALPIGGKRIEVRVAGIARDFARTWGSVLFPIDEYRRITGDSRANDIAVHLAPGVDARQAEEAIRHAVPHAHGIVIEDAQELHRRSLAIFDRSFAVTYALEAIAVVISLAGVTSSFAALAWSRRREFGVLRFLGLRRREVLGLLAVEGFATGLLGALVGLVSGIAVSLVLVHVVNRQSFHWSLEIHWPLAGLAALLAAIVAMCAFGARASAALAVRHEAVRAVKDDS